MDKVIERQTNELEELEKKIEGLKLSLPSGDKNQKKAFKKKVDTMRDELSRRHEQERYDFHITNEADSEPESDIQPQNSDSKTTQSTAVEEKELEISTNTQPKQSKQSKKKQKKALLVQKMEEEAELEAQNQVDYLKLETEAIQKLIQPKGLLIKEIPPDGHCLFNSISDQLKTQYNQEKSAVELRELCCQELINHSDNYLPFFTTKDGDLATQEEYLEYCNTMKNTAAWGGNLELSALSSTLKLPIQVYQMSGPLIKIGEDYQSNKPIILSYHKHQYGLGAHYNSLRNQSSN